MSFSLVARVICIFYRTNKKSKRRIIYLLWSSYLSSDLNFISSLSLLSQALTSYISYDLNLIGLHQWHPAQYCWFIFGERWSTRPRHRPRSWPSASSAVTSWVHSLKTCYNCIFTFGVYFFNVPLYFLLDVHPYGRQKPLPVLYGGVLARCLGRHG